MKALDGKKRRSISWTEDAEAFDAAVRDDKGPLPATFLLQDIWMFGCTKPTSEVAAVAQTRCAGPSWDRNL